MNLAEIQEQIRNEGADGWLFFDHHHRDPIAYRVLGLSEALHVTRRWYYFVPAQGDPSKLVHRIEDKMLDSLPGGKTTYSSWGEMQDALRSILGNISRVAMQFSPHCMIPYVSLVDAGTVDLIRNIGKDVVTSASLVQYFEARWSEEQLEMHREAGRKVDRVRRQAFEEVGKKLRAEGSVSEITIAEFIRRRFREEHLTADDMPIVAVNANAANPHYAPSAEQSAVIKAGDFVLIDLWAKLERPGAVYYDITWTGFAGHQPPSEIQNVFEIVRSARDRAVEFVRAARAEGRPVRGFEVDDVVRGRIGEKGLAGYFTHRTGHSIGEEVHGNGANIDNLETHDDRVIIPRTCFSVEPGVYLPGKFGVRTELDCYVSDNSADPTGEVQTEIVTIAS
jgi:Xaa-Pro aminopeptidase